MHRAGVALQSIIDQALIDTTVRPDLSIDDFYLLVSTIPAGHTPDTLDRWVELILNGIAAAR